MQDLWTTLRAMLVTVVVCCVGYPAMLLAFAQTVTPYRANGSLIRVDGTIVGSAQIAQPFSQPKYFWPRPSAVDYAGDAAGGSNLSPTNPELTARAERIIARLDGRGPVPADLVSASGSGLDPHITLRAARYQAGRVAAARGVSETRILEFIDTHRAETMLDRLGGQPLVNVLRLNLALDATVE